MKTLIILIVLAWQGMSVTEIISRAEWTNAEIARVTKARREAREAELRAVGVGGNRLALFVEGGDWYLPGCVLATDDAARLARARVLFQWVDERDGAITIRKLVFDGDEYSFSERTARGAEKARALCQ